MSEKTLKIVTLKWLPYPTNQKAQQNRVANHSARIIKKPFKSYFLTLQEIVSKYSKLKEEYINYGTNNNVS